LSEKLKDMAANNIIVIPGPFPGLIGKRNPESSVSAFLTCKSKVTGLQSPSMDFALRANLRLFKFVPDEFVPLARE
jgi:hypothetical protein